MSNFQALLSLVSFQTIPQFYLQALGVYRLFKEIERAELGGLDRLFDRALAGKKDEARFRAYGRKPLEQCHAIHAWHAEVGNYHHGIEGADFLHRFHTVGSGLNLVSPTQKQFGKALACI